MHITVFIYFNLQLPIKPYFYNVDRKKIIDTMNMFYVSFDILIVNIICYSKEKLTIKAFEITSFSVFKFLYGMKFFKLQNFLEIKENVLFYTLLKSMPNLRYQQILFKVCLRTYFKTTFIAFLCLLSNSLSYSRCF